MLDLGYSDSDSDSEQTPQLPAPTSPRKSSGLSKLLPKPKSRKQKDHTADKDAPKKIIVNLPKFDKEDKDGRPTKKARTSGMSRLSAMLPAPKRSGALVPQTTEPEQDAKISDPQQPKAVEDVAKLNTKTSNGSNTMFVPQSVARKPIQPMSAFRKKDPATTGASRKPRVEPSKPKVSLFGAATTMASNPQPKVTRPIAAGDYEPIMVEAVKPIRRPIEDTDYFDEDLGFDGGSTADAQQSPYGTSLSVIQSAQDLDSLAREAGLDQSELRQLYGRNGPGKEPIKFATFSVDEEYRRNEIEKESGLAQEVKPVRTVAPGRHQLQSLLNIAQSQRGALEESFAQGKSNRREASSRYGW